MSAYSSIKNQIFLLFENIFYETIQLSFDRRKNWKKKKKKEGDFNYERVVNRACSKRELLEFDEKLKRNDESHREMEKFQETRRKDSRGNNNLPEVITWFDGLGSNRKFPWDHCNLAYC